MRISGLVRGVFFAVALSGLVAGCAQVPEDPDARAAYEANNDPIEDVNRAIFGFNLTIDRVFVRQFAAAYRELPDMVKDSVRNFLRYLKTPVILANNILQGDQEGASDTIGRGLINTFGLGLFDIANGNGNGIPYRDEDFGQTLAVWGVGEGAYLQIPFLGPSTVRDAGGKVVDMFFDPFTYWGFNSDSSGPEAWRGGRIGMDLVDSRSRNLEQIEDLETTSLDFYATVRSLYRQQRENMIRNGDSDESSNSFPDIDFDDEVAEDTALLE